MKKFFESQLRHLLTFIPGVVTFLADFGITDEQIAQAVSALAAVAVVFVTRTLLFIVDRYVPSLGKRVRRLLDEGSGKRRLPLLIALASLGSFTFPSCTGGRIYYQDSSTGAKGGITITDGRPTWFARLVDKDGNLIIIEGTK